MNIKNPEAKNINLKSFFKEKFDTKINIYFVHAQPIYNSMIATAGL